MLDYWKGCANSTSKYWAKFTKVSNGVTDWLNDKAWQYNRTMEGYMCMITIAWEKKTTCYVLQMHFWGLRWVQRNPQSTTTLFMRRIFLCIFVHTPWFISKKLPYNVIIVLWKKSIRDNKLFLVRICRKLFCCRPSIQCLVDNSSMERNIYLLKFHFARKVFVKYITNNVLSVKC